MTIDEYHKITGNYPVLGFSLPAISFDEAQEFLNRLGYEVLQHSAVKSTQMIESVPCEGTVRNVGPKVDMLRDFVVAVKDKNDLPWRFTDENYKDFEFKYVFQKEIKRKLLGF